MPYLKSINPHNNEILKEYEEYDQQNIDDILQKSSQAFLTWKETSFHHRSALMRQCAEHLLKNKRNLSELIVLEMGKPITQALAEIEKCAAVCDYYATHAEEFLKDEIVESDASKSLISYEPLGCVLAIMPWNFPFWQLFRFAAPALMAGNVGVLKHASNVPQCSMAIEKIFTDAGFPDGVFQSVIIGSEKVKYLIEHPIVKAVTLTGSEKAGSDVAMLAGKNIKKTVLELGGSDCFIVLADADINDAANFAVRSRMINTGQSCIAAKRFIVAKEVYEDFLKKMEEHISRLKIGDPINEQTDIGPMAREDLAKGLEAQILQCIQQGAVLRYGGGRPIRNKAYIYPAILINVKPGMPAYQEELFGPVAIVFKTENTDDALRIANDTKFGLGASIWTKDLKKGFDLAKKIEAGSVFINGIVKSDQRLPFGGIKNSGYGRELSYHGIREFVNIKTIWIK